MNKIHIQWWVAALLVSAAGGGRVNAHEGPEHEIEVLTEKMKNSGESAELLAERAVEYRLLGKLPEAIKDLERAVVLDPESLVIHRELGRAHFLNGKADDALTTLARALRLPSDDTSEVASVRILRAEVLRSKKDYKKALEDCDNAIALHKENPEWYLLRSDIQGQLKAHQQRLAGLEAGIKETGAGVLEIERVEALIDAGKFDVALAIIESQMQDSRIKSSWLIRRARVKMGQGKKAEGSEDLKAALLEIGTRLNAKSPDLPLLLDKARALELLGDNREALSSYKTARDQGADDSVKDKIKALEENTATPAAPETGSGTAK
jgi:tetratricopeptide (TPR) repeat protein